mmetsp:Transcript_101823/g.276810  ORF Transcript_101823/g.276810 Transcript_101823/m.276810 type:complete len:130 (+) Transcript_101823:793-1182(+)
MMTTTKHSTTTKYAKAGQSKCKGIDRTKNTATNKSHGPKIAVQIAVMLIDLRLPLAKGGSRTSLPSPDIASRMLGGLYPSGPRSASIAPYCPYGWPNCAILFAASWRTVACLQDEYESQEGPGPMQPET